jgi:hypothetical protein
MNIYIFERLESVSGNYHPEGGCVIIAKDKNHAMTLVVKNPYLCITEDDWNNCDMYALHDALNDVGRIYIFPDAGCC